MNLPAISVVMPVYNGEAHIAEAIVSILAQTFTDFEFIIVDDASTDATSSIITGYALQDDRIRIIRNATNSKIAASLNKGIAASRALLIARMDADDWAHPERLAKQYFFMKAHPEIAVCGTWLEVYETAALWKYPCCDEEIHTHLLFYSCIAHPTVMFKKKLILHMMGGYDTLMPPVEDYDLWARLSMQKDVLFANIPEILLRYRTYPTHDRSQYQERQRVYANKVRLNLLKGIAIELTEKNIQAHYMLCGAMQVENSESIRRCGMWAIDLLKANTQLKIYDMAKLTAIVRIRWRETMGYVACANPFVACLFFIVDRKLSKNNKYSFGSSDFFYSIKQTVWMFARGLKKKLLSYARYLGVFSTKKVHSKMDNTSA